MEIGQPPEPRKRKVRLKTKPAGQMALDGMELIETPARKEPTVDEAFNTFWAAYPRKVDKYQARLNWDRLMKDKTVKVKEIMDGLEAQIPTLLQRGPFVPHAATWLRHHRWRDQVEDIAPHEPTQAEKLYLAELRRFKDGKL